MSENDVLEIESELSNFFLAKTNQHATLDSDKKFRWEYGQEAFVYTASIPANIVWLSQRSEPKGKFCFLFLITVEPLL